MHVVGPDAHPGPAAGRHPQRATGGGEREREVGGGCIGPAHLRRRERGRKEGGRQAERGRGGGGEEGRKGGREEGREGGEGRKGEGGKEGEAREASAASFSVLGSAYPKEHERAQRSTVTVASSNVTARTAAPGALPRSLARLLSSPLPPSLPPSLEHGQRLEEAQPPPAICLSLSLSLSLSHTHTHTHLLSPPPRAATPLSHVPCPLSRLPAWPHVIFHETYLKKVPDPQDTSGLT